MSHSHAEASGGPPAKKLKHVCHMGTQEVIHFRSFKSLPGKVEDFELKVRRHFFVFCLFFKCTFAT